MSVAVAPDALARGSTLRRAAGKTLTVGPVLGRGGQGYVYEVAGETNVVLKQINEKTKRDHPEIEQRLAAMINQPPVGARDTTGHVVLAWPTELVFDGASFIGFVMPRIARSDATELHSVSNPTNRRDPGPDEPEWIRGFDWRYLLQTAANLALATESLHQSGYVIGDFNERNILVTKNARVALIDCDSMQVPNPAGGVFLSFGFRDEFIAPEVRRRGAPQRKRLPSSDLFALAVHVHQLLLEGANPFDGIWQGQGDPPAKAERIARGLYAYSGNRQLRPPTSPPLGELYESLPREIRDFFSRAFVAALHDSELRPTGAEWAKVLQATASNLQRCKRDRQHYYAAGNARCPWCRYLTPLQRPLPAARATASSATRTIRRQTRTVAQRPPMVVRPAPTIVVGARSRGKAWLTATVSAAVIAVIAGAVVLGRSGSSPSAPPASNQVPPSGSGGTATSTRQNSASSGGGGSLPRAKGSSSHGAGTATVKASQSQTSQAKSNSEGRSGTTSIGESGSHGASPPPSASPLTGQSSSRPAAGSIGGAAAGLQGKSNTPSSDRISGLQGKSSTPSGSSGLGLTGSSSP